MIKVKKDLSNIPYSLTLKKNYNDEDVKNELIKIYNSKCCYCESKLSKNFAVEHYRPKSKYKWLEFSWSNLLLICNSCNSSKGANFETINKIEELKISEIDYHKSAETLNKEEEPFFLHPEYDDCEKYFIFDKSGNIFSNNIRGNYTIDEINLKDKRLTTSRYNVILNFQKDLKLEKDKNIIRHEIKKFITESKKNSSQFTAFRRYIVKNELKNILKDLNIIKT